ncbi:hypothetical protein ACF0H5_014597 [Mactra antiquata]
MRGIITHPPDYYHSKDLFKSDSEIACSATKDKYSVIHQPLLNIEPKYYIPDELRMMMRITDILIRTLIDDANSKDNYSKITGGHTDNLKILIEAKCSCGVSFKTWKNKAGELEYTSLSSVDKKKILRLLPDELLFGVHEDTLESVIKLWKDFENIYHLITCQTTASISASEVHGIIKQFLCDFLTLVQMKREGYQPKNVTPYLRVLLYHVPHFLQKFGGLSQFSGQSVEKTNDVLKNICQTKSNKLDATKDDRLVRKRIENAHMNVAQRTRRKYTKTI